MDEKNKGSDGGCLFGTSTFEGSYIGIILKSNVLRSRDYGVEKASQRFFSKSVQELSLSEGAMLAGLAKAPNGYSPTEHPEKALKRRNVVLQSMENAGII